MTARRRAPRRRSASRGRLASRSTWVLVALAGLAGLWWWLRAEEPAPPLDEIGDASRERLEAVVREADREAEAP